MQYGVAKPERVGTTVISGGRRLAWAQWGPARGTPLLFFSGAAMGRSLGFGADVLTTLDLCLIAVDRPGLGNSDPDPGRTLTGWVDDVRALVEELDLGAVRIVSYSQGAPFALACAAHGIPEAVAVVSGQDDFTHASTTDMLPPEVADLVRAVTTDPADVETDFANAANADMIWRLVTETSSPTDLEVYTAPSFAAAYRHALDEGFTQGAASYARDFVLAVGRWPFDLADIRVPVDLWYGGLDASTVHSPDFGETLARRIPTARRHFLPDAGASLLWTHADAILSALAS